MIKRLYSKFQLLLVSILIVFTSSSVYSQTKSEVGKPNSNVEFAFKLYPTNNMWNFIKLDTRNGKMWLVQFTTEESHKRFESPLNDIDLSKIDGKENICGRFELYPTQNFYNFILLDKMNGATYQVQWGFDPENRGILLIGVSGSQQL